MICQEDLPRRPASPGKPNQTGLQGQHGALFNGVALDLHRCNQDPTLAFFMGTPRWPREPTDAQSIMKPQQLYEETNKGKV